MGDFNAAPTSPAVRFLTREAGFVDAFARVNPATPGFTDGQDVEAARADRRSADRLRVSGAGPARARPGGREPLVLDEPRRSGRVRWPSDHYGVLAEITLDEPPSRLIGRGISGGGGRGGGGG